MKISLRKAAFNIIFLLFLIGPSILFAQVIDLENNEGTFIQIVADELVIPLQEKLELNRELALRFALIKTKADLDSYLSMTSDRSPLNNLSPPARQRFLDSLIFSGRGLGSFSHTDLENELTATEIYGILSLFGAQDLISLMEPSRVETSLDKTLVKSNKDGARTQTIDCPYNTIWGSSTCGGGVKDFYCTDLGVCNYREGSSCAASCGSGPGNH